VCKYFPFLADSKDMRSQVTRAEQIFEFLPIITISSIQNHKTCAIHEVTTSWLHHLCILATSLQVVSPEAVFQTYNFSTGFLHPSYNQRQGHESLWRRCRTIIKRKKSDTYRLHSMEMVPLDSSAMNMKPLSQIWPHVWIYYLKWTNRFTYNT
jgi:hypothetical protein